MIVLLVFAVLAGAGTALSPCVLPVLPALLSASGVGGRRRPLGIVIGLSVTFTVTIVGLANVVGGVGLGNDPLRDLSIAVLLVFGVSLLAPAPVGPHRGAALAAGALRPPLERRRLPLRPARRGALGFVYTPCASPDPRGGHLRQRGHRTDDHAGARLRGRLGCGAARARVRRQAAVRPDSPGRARARAAARAGRRDDRSPGSRSPPAWTSTSTSSSPSTSPTSTSQPALECSPTVTSRLPQITGHRAQLRRRQRLLGVRRERLGVETRRGRAVRQPADAAGRRALVCRTSGAAPEFAETEKLVQHPRREAAVARLAARAASCSSTSGPTPASTASARSPT